MRNTGVVRSLYIIDRARQRIAYQKAVVSKLRFDRNASNASLANDMLVAMEERLSLLLEQHAKLIANENLLEVRIKTSSGPS